MSEMYVVMFRFALGQRVRWSKRPEGHFTIVAQLYEVRRLLTPVQSYRLKEDGVCWLVLADEPDLSIIEDTP